MRAMYYASLCAMRTGMDILTEEEGVVIEEIRGHGGFFKGGDTGQRMMAAALNVPVSIPATAGEGGAWGMAVLAAYMLGADAGAVAAGLPRRAHRREHRQARRARPARREGLHRVLRPPQEGPRHRARGGQGAALSS